MFGIDWDEIPSAFSDNSVEVEDIGCDITDDQILMFQQGYNVDNISLSVHSVMRYFVSTKEFIYANSQL